MKRNKITALLLAAVTVLTLAGCTAAFAEEALLGAAAPVNTAVTPVGDAEVDALWAATEAKIDRILAGQSEQIVAAEGHTTWYVSANGSDKADGLTPETAWKSLDRVIVKSKKTIQPGDVVCFERGGIYRNTGETPFAPLSCVIYTAYGEGSLPILTTAMMDLADPSYWTETDVPGVWRTYRGVDRFDIGNLVFNGGEAQGSKMIPQYNADGEIVRDAVTGLPMTGWRDMNGDGQFCYTVEDGRNTLYLYCPAGNPGEVYTSINSCRMLDIVSDSSTGAVLDQLSFRYGGKDAVTMGTNQNLTVQNCEIAYIGGCVNATEKRGDPNVVTREGAGVRSDGNREGFSVTNCYIHNCYAIGIDARLGNSPAAVHVTLADNVIAYCAQGIVLTGEGKSDLIEVTGNHLWYAAMEKPAEYTSSYTGNGGALQIHTTVPGMRYVLKDNVIAMAAVSLLSMDPALATAAFSGNTYLADASCMATVDGTVYAWGGDAAGAVASVGGDTTASFLIYQSGETAGERTVPSAVLPADVKAGDTVSFGACEQDGDQSDGTEAIEWLVLDVTDGKALLLSRYVLDSRPFEQLDGFIGWGTSAMAEWLNGAFLNTAFTAEEQAKLNLRKTALQSSGMYFDSNARWDGGAESRVFLLSEQELIAALGAEALGAEATPYALSLDGFGQHLTAEDGYAAYWLCSYGYTNRYAAQINCRGELDAHGAVGNSYANAGVRPAILVTVG